MAARPKKVRRAEPSDLGKLEALRSSMAYPGSLLHDEESFFGDALQRLREYLSSPEDYPDWRVLLLEDEDEATGYLLFVVDQKHGVTHQLQARLLDYAVFSFEALSALVERARKVVAAFENDYLVVDLPAQDRRLQLWFYRCGFRAEQQRSVKRIERGHQGASTPAFLVRAAGPDDLPLLLEIHAAYTPAYLPAGRDTDLETLEFGYQMTYLALDLEGADGSSYLVLEESGSGALAGYVFLKPGLVFGQTRSYYMYDIAVAPAFAGRGLSKYLVGAAETLTGREGGFLYGDGSFNSPVIANWHKHMGAVHDSTLFALDCRARED